MEDESSGSDPRPPDSLLPYDAWTEAALRQVMVCALRYVAENGLPGEHHFYITFRTDSPGVTIPARLRAQYPEEMTIVLQHQFWDLMVDEKAAVLSVGLSFGGVPSTLAIPLAAVSAFADPYARYGLRFHVSAPAAPEEAPAESDAKPEAGQGAESGAETPPPSPAAQAPAGTEAPQVVSLDAFRRRPNPKNN